MDGSSIARQTRSAIPRDQKGMQSRHNYDVAKVRFLYGLQAKTPGAVKACDPASSVPNFIEARRLNRRRKTDVEGEEFVSFEGLSTVWTLFFYQLFVSALLLWRSSLVTADSQCFTEAMVVRSYRSLEEDECSLWVWTWTSPFIANLQAMWSFYFTSSGAWLSLVSSPSSSPSLFPSP